MKTNPYIVISAYVARVEHGKVVYVREYSDASGRLVATDYMEYAEWVAQLELIAKDVLA